jgi:hypothetical protein
VALLPAGLAAQQSVAQKSSTELDLAVTYNAQRGHVAHSGDFWAQGGSAELSATFYRGLGAVAHVTGTRADNLGSSNVGLTLVTTTFGLRYTRPLAVRKASAQRVNLFAEALGGVANGDNSVFPSPLGAQSNATSLALELGGGADMPLSHRFAVRLLQASWLRTQLPSGASSIQNNLQLGTGLVFRFH